MPIYGADYYKGVSGWTVSDSTSKWAVTTSAFTTLNVATTSVSQTVTNFYKVWNNNTNFWYPAGGFIAQPVPVPKKPSRWFKKKREIVENRARILLLSVLDAEQKAEFEVHKRFRVIGKSGAEYILLYGRAWSLRRIAKGRINLEACVHTIENVPVADNMVALKLMLESDDAALLKLANTHKVDRALTNYGNVDSLDELGLAA